MNRFEPHRRGAIDPWVGSSGRAESGWSAFAASIAITTVSVPTGLVVGWLTEGAPRSDPGTFMAVLVIATVVAAFFGVVLGAVAGLLVAVCYPALEGRPLLTRVAACGLTLVLMAAGTWSLSGSFDLASMLIWPYGIALALVAYFAPSIILVSGRNPMVGSEV